MKSVSAYGIFKWFYVAILILACYGLSLLPFSYSYFNSSFMTYGYNKKVCQWVEGEELLFSGTVRSLAVGFHTYINRENPDAKFRLDEECPDR